MQQELFRHEETYCVPAGQIIGISPVPDTSCFPPPRPFQVEAHNRLRAGVKAGHRVQMLMSPTGSGKTYLSMGLVKEALKKGKRVLFIADRTVLIDQTSKVADAYGLTDHGIIQANHWRTDPRKRFQIGSVQTIARRRKLQFDLVIVDEAHCLYKGWVDLVTSSCAVVVLLSATPFSKGLGQIASNLVNAATMSELTASGVLVPMKIYSCSKVNMNGAATCGGEWTDVAAAERGMEIVGDVVKEWSQLAQGRKTIGFGATITHCKEMAKQFNEAGIKAAVFCADTTPEERNMMLEEYRQPGANLRVLLSVEALAKGFDCPEVSCILDVRPLRKSLSSAIQMWGRGLRSYVGKEDCLLLDFSGNIIRFADDFSEVFYNGLDRLDAGERLDRTIRRDEEKKEWPCQKCGFTPCGKKCLQCGNERRIQNLVEHEAGTMAEVFLGKTKLADDLRHLWEQICTYAKGNGKPETAKGRAYHLYREITGGLNPPSQWQFETMANVPVTRSVQNKIMQKRLAFIKAMEKVTKTDANMDFTGG